MKLPINRWILDDLGHFLWFMNFKRIIEERERKKRSEERREGKEEKIWKEKEFWERNGVKKARLRVSSFKAEILCFGAFLDRQSI